MLQLINNLVTVVGGFFKKALLPLLAFKYGKDTQKLREAKKDAKFSKTADTTDNTIHSLSESDIDKLI